MWEFICLTFQVSSLEKFSGVIFWRSPLRLRQAFAHVWFSTLTEIMTLKSEGNLKNVKDSNDFWSRNIIFDSFFSHLSLIPRLKILSYPFRVRSLLWTTSSFKVWVTLNSDVFSRVILGPSSWIFALKTFFCTLIETSEFFSFTSVLIEIQVAHFQGGERYQLNFQQGCRAFVQKLSTNRKFFSHKK